LESQTLMRFPVQHSPYLLCQFFLHHGFHDKLTDADFLAFSADTVSLYPVQRMIGILFRTPSILDKNRRVLVDTIRKDVNNPTASDNYIGLVLVW
jgi:hypothetical protein